MGARCSRRVVRRAVSASRKSKDIELMSTRLPGARYKSIFDRGRSIKGRLLVAWYSETPGAECRAGVIVSKKSFHDAVDRNRAKRLMREAFRLMVKAQEMPKNVEWILIAKHAIIKAKTELVMEELRWCVKRLSCS